jgi:maltodextrin utilization protein YvdJ
MNDAIFAMLVFSIPLTLIFTRFYLRLQELKLKNDTGTGDSNEIRKEMGNLVADNEELKERMKNLEYILTDKKRHINLEYEKEQILINQQNKMN